MADPKPRPQRGFRGPYAVFSDEELDYVRLRLAEDEDPTAVAIREKIDSTLDPAHVQMRQPHR